MSKIRCLVPALALALGAVMALDAQILIEGSIIQSTEDGTGPAIENPSLNKILDGNSYSVSLIFTKSITGPGIYTGFGSANFRDLTIPSVVESDFTSGSLTVIQQGSVDVFSGLLCRAAADGCNAGNQLDLNFAIPAAALLKVGLTVASAVPSLTPLDLLEDDGATDIQGSVTSYSSATPEPGTILLVGGGLAAGIWFRRRRQQSGAARPAQVFRTEEK